MSSDVIIPLAISAIFKVAAAAFVGVCGAAVLTWLRSHQNTKDINHAFAKIRNLEGKLDGRERAAKEKTLQE